MLDQMEMAMVTMAKVKASTNIPNNLEKGFCENKAPFLLNELLKTRYGL